MASEKGGAQTVGGDSSGVVGPGVRRKKVELSGKVWESLPKGVRAPYAKSETLHLGT